MNYFLNSTEQKGSDSSKNIDGALQSILTMAKAEVVQLLFEPSGKNSFKKSQCVFRGAIPEISVLDTLTDFTQRNSHIAKGEVIQIPQNSGIGFNGKSSELSWWSLPVYAQQKRNAILNLALTEQGNGMMFLGKYLKELIIPLLPIFAGSLHTEQALEYISFGFLSKLDTVESKKDLYQLIEQHRDALMGFEGFTIYTLGEDEDNLVHFFEETQEQQNFKSALKVVNLPQDDNLKSIYFNKNNVEAVDMEMVEYTEDHSLFFREKSQWKNSPTFLYKLTDIGQVKAMLLFVFDKALEEKPELVKLLNLVGEKLSRKIFELHSRAEVEALEREHLELMALKDSLKGIRDTRDMLALLEPSVATITGNKSHCIAMVQEDNLHLNISCNSANEVSVEPDECICEFSQIPIQDKLISKALLGERPLCFDLDLLRTRSALPEYLSCRAGINDGRIVIAALRGKDKIFGVWMLWPSEEMSTTRKQLWQINKLSKLLAEAIENVC